MCEWHENNREPILPRYEFLRPDVVQFAGDEVEFENYIKTPTFYKKAKLSDSCGFLYLEDDVRLEFPNNFKVETVEEFDILICLDNDHELLEYLNPKGKILIKKVNK